MTTPQKRPAGDAPDPSARPRAEIKVFISHRDSVCDECKESLGRHAWIVLAGENKALCLACADLDHLTFLPSGDTALTRRSRKNSRLSAVVLKWSRARRRYERQGLLVEEAALSAAEAECQSDSEARRRQRERAAARRAELDDTFVGKFAERVRELYPACPQGRERSIAEHACLKYSGRVGRSASANELDENAVRMAVVAHIRHIETEYEELLGAGHDRADARRLVAARVNRVLQGWSENPD